MQMPVPGYGIPFDTKGAAERPDPAVRYRVVFNATRGASKTGSVLPALERAARLLNLLAQEGVHVQTGDVAIVVSGPATPGVLTDAAYARHANDPQVHANPNLPLIDALQKAGAVVSVCSLPPLAPRRAATLFRTYAGDTCMTPPLRTEAR